MEQADNGAAPSAAETTPVVEAPTVEQTMEAVWSKMNPQDNVSRGEGGKFQAVEPQKTEAAPADQATEQAPVEAKSEPALPPIAAPQSLPAEVKAKWDSLPREWQETFAKRETEARKLISEMGETAKAGEPIRQVLTRYQHVFRGQEPSQAIEKLAAASDFLDRDAPAALKWLADAYGVDLSMLVARPTEGETPETGEIRSLKAEIAQLKRALSDTNTKITSREQHETAAQQKSLAETVEKFASDKPHWDELEGDILQQIHALKAAGETDPGKLLEKAYERALKLNDGVQAKLSEEKRKAEEKSKAEEAKRKADEAKRQASLNVKSNASTSPRKSKSPWDTMSEVADRLM